MLCNPLKAVYYNNFISNCKYLEKRSAINTQLHSVHHVENIENVEDRKSVKMSQIAKRFVKRENFN